MPVRTASVADVAALADLRRRWSPPARPQTAEEHAAFTSHLETWMRQLGDRLICTVAEIDGELVGMAWLVCFERVPNPDAPVRLSGDIQSVYVRPEYRGRGLGKQLVRAICDSADELGVAKVSVDADESTVEFYERCGFRSSGVLLQRSRPPLTPGR